jgi:hypothetical protein
VEEGSRTALPSVTFDAYTLRFEYTGGGYTHAPVEWNAEVVSVDLEPGEWTVYADGYIESVVLGTGRATVYVSEGTVTPVTIRIGVNTGAGVQGTLKYTVSYPATDHTYDTQTLTVRDALGATIGDPVDITNGEEESLQLNAGVYFVGVVINDTAQRTGVARTSVVHIYGEQETSLEIKIGDEDFTAIVPLVVTARLTAPDEIMTKRAVAIYTSTKEWQATEDTAVLTGPVEITFWVPSSSESVYVRQQIYMNETPLVGEFVLVNIDPEQPATASLEDTLYTITVSDVTEHGTVQSIYPAAFPGTTVPITAKADPDAFFDGKLAVLSDSTPVTMDSKTDGHFTMPDQDVEVYAGFHQFVQYGKAGGTGNGMSWETASGDLQMMIDKLAALSATYAAVYTGPYIVKLGAGTYKPKYTPMIPASAEGPYEHTDGGRDNAFILRPKVQVWGGYPADGGGETDEANRESRFDTYGEADPTYTAFLSGDLDYSGGIPDNNDAYHVVLGVNIPDDSGTVLDGLTISGGNANGGSDILVGDKSISRRTGGGIYNNSSLALIRVTISDNKADENGGGICSVGASLTMQRVTIAKNSATVRGGGMYNEGVELDLSDVTISYNTVTAGADPDHGGGGIYNTGNTTLVKLTGVVISNNAANSVDGVMTSGKGGGIYNNDISPSSSLTEVTISGNTAASDGGGVYFRGSFTMSGGTIGGDTGDKANRAVNGGGVYFNGTNFTMNGGAISGNQTTGSQNSNGGGVYVADGTFEMSGTAVVSGNQTTGSNSDGGGVYVAGGTFNMSGGTISRNTAHTNGGGVVVTGAGASFTMSGGTIGGSTDDEANSAGNQGGGVIVFGDGASFTMSGGTISGNQTTGSYPSHGGGVYAVGGTFKMNNGTISRNTAANFGGGVYFKGTNFTMSGGIIGGDTDDEANSASRGGGVYVEGGSFTMNENNKAAVSGNEDTGTGSYSGGGGVYVEDGTFSLSGNAAVSGNQATGSYSYGGGVYFSGISFTMSETAAISGNQAYSGGGVYVGSGSFEKTGGAIYGDKKEDTTPEDSTLQNTAYTSETGHAAFVYYESNPKKRNTTAGAGIDLDNSADDNWE